MTSSTHNFAVPLAKKSISLPGSNASRTSDMSASDLYLAHTSPMSSFAPPSSMQKFFKEPMALSSSASSPSSMPSSMINSYQLPFTFNEEEEDEEENEDDLYQNFVDSQDQPMSATGKRRASIDAIEAASSNGVYASVNYGQAQPPFEQHESMVNSFLAKSFPPPSLFLPPDAIHDSRSALDPSASFEFPSSSSSNIYVCYWVECYKQFRTQSQLVLHIEYCHIDQQRYCQDNYTCHWINCPRQSRPFNARYKLLNHMRIHSGEKPNKCPHPGCVKAFSRQENLKIHIRSHTGEKPYICHYVNCGKAFSNSSDRAKHQRTHFNSKPYACQMVNCTKRYTDPSSLRKHMKTHGKNKLHFTKLSASCDEAAMSSLFDPQFRNLSSSINVPMTVHPSNVMSNGLGNGMLSPPFADPNNNLLSKSWCVNGSNTYDRPSWFVGGNVNVALKQSVDNLNSNQHFYESCVKNGMPSPLMNSLDVKSEISKPPPLSFNSKHEWSPIPMVAQSTPNSRSSIANFRGFTSCDESTLRQQLQAASSLGDFVDNPKHHQSHQRISMFGNTMPNYPCKGNQHINLDSNNNGHLNQTMILPIGGTSGLTNDCLNGNAPQQLTNDTTDNRFIFAQSMSECDTTTTTSITNGGNGNDFDKFIQELFLTQKE